jgi:hypothetical protein
VRADPLTAPLRDGRRIRHRRRGQLKAARGGPEEARHLASLPVARAVAIRLDTRAARERTRAAGSGRDPGQATASWSLPALAAVVVPVLILLIVVLA